MESEDEVWPQERVRLSLTGTPRNRAQLISMTACQSPECVFTGTEPAQYEISAAVKGWKLIQTEQVTLTPPQVKSVSLKLRNTQTWITVRLIDVDSKPVPGVRYRLKLPDGSEKEGVLDQDGSAHYDQIDPGSCSVCFPELDQDAWAPVG